MNFSPSASDLSHSFKVENIIVHPDYVPDHPSNQHDLAVIKIREEEINEKGEGRNWYRFFVSVVIMNKIDKQNGD